ncbi:hypothetical protein lerEdw1_010344 [Lerista edwardsae]|nr:hypothetical protein lerEdw1_010344 [Lerista edwardsae]
MSRMAHRLKAATAPMGIFTGSGLEPTHRFSLPYTIPAMAVASNLSTTPSSSCHHRDGKDYIPLNITLCPDGGSAPKICILDENVSERIKRWSAVEASFNSKNRPLSVKTFDEVPVETGKVIHEECESDSGMVLTLDEIKSRKRLEIRSWPYGIMALA